MRYFIPFILLLLASTAYSQKYGIETDRERTGLRGPVSGFVQQGYVTGPDGQWVDCSSFDDAGNRTNGTYAMVADDQWVNCEHALSEHVAYTPEGFERLWYKMYTYETAISDTSTYTFNASGQITSKSTMGLDDRTPRVLEFFYDKNGNLTRYTPVMGDVVIERDQSGREIRRTQYGSTSQKDYDEEGTLIKETTFITATNPAFNMSDTITKTYNYDTLTTSSGQHVWRMIIEKESRIGGREKTIVLYELGDSSFFKSIITSYSKNPELLIANYDAPDSSFGITITTCDPVGNWQYVFQQSYSTADSLPSNNFVVNESNCTKMFDYEYDPYNNWTAMIFKERINGSLVPTKKYTREISYFN